MYSGTDKEPMVGGQVRLRKRGEKYVQVQDVRKVRGAEVN